MKSLAFISLLLLSCFTGQSNANENNALFGDTDEAVFFFSYHCAACYETSVFLAAWESKHPQVKLRRVPVFGESQWRAGARLYFLLELSKEKHSLSAFKRNKTAYSMITHAVAIEDTRSFHLELLKKYGMEFTAFEFDAWWRASEQMMALSSGILKDVEEEIAVLTPPFVRVFKQGEIPTYIEAGEPLAFLKQLNRELK